VRKSIIFSYLLAALSLADCQAAGIQIGRTRVIYEAKSREVALTLVNKEQELPWLVQSWTDNGDEKRNKVYELPGRARPCRPIVNLFFT